MNFKAKETFTYPDQVSVLIIGAKEAYDYLVPKDQIFTLGDLVKVPLKSKEKLGIILKSGTEKIPKEKLKFIHNKHENYSLPKLCIDFIKWFSEYNITPIGKSLKLIIPNEDITKNYRRKKEIIKPETPEIILNKEQIKAYEKISNQLLKNKFSPLLLHGITGSGKTEVYFKAITDILKSNKQSGGKSQILIMLPEISLIESFMMRFEKYFKSKPALWHSGISLADKKAIWQKTINGELEIIVGARSSLFLPFKNLSLIIIDEEHDASYKQEEQTIYNARDMAVLRAKLGQIPIILSSATPSIESINNAYEKKYSLIELKERYGNAELPTIEVIDLRKNRPTNYTLENQEKQGCLSPPLIQKIIKTLTAKEQSLLFLNRRGYSPFAICSECGHKYECPNCTSWMVLHKASQKMICHHCDYKMKPPQKCPKCEAENAITFLGPGVERIEEEIKSRFPNAKTLILSSDTIDEGEKAKAAIDKIKSNKIDIIISTQIFAKGHHFPNLTLVGIVDGDFSLKGGDLRASEKTFQILNQVSGRAGREEKKGKVIIQTHNPKNKIMEAITQNDFKAFANQEIYERRLMKMPPFGKLCAIIISGKNEEKLIHLSRQMIKCAPKGNNFEILGPSPAPIYKLRNKYRIRFLIRADKNIKIQLIVNEWQNRVKPPSTIKLKVDIDPINFF
jgi:primosomal protein N' (replication factor Y)